MTFWRTVVVTEEPRIPLHVVQIFGYGTGEVQVLKGSGTPDRQTWGATHWPARRSPGDALRIRARR